MKLIFIAGPYGAHLPHRQILDNIETARRAAIHLAHAKLYFICPHLNSAMFHTIWPPIPETHFRAMYIHILGTCHALYVLKNWRASEGTRAEIDYAQDKKIPTYFSISKLLKDAKDGKF